MTSNKNTNQIQGFTLVELLLAMTGVAILLVAVATTTIQLMNMYHKGITIKTINSAGREVGDMIKRDGLSAKGRDIVQVAPSDSGTGGLGRLCFGSYTYVWNTPENLRSRDASVGVVYDDDPSHSKIVFARVADPDGSLCKATRGQYPKVITKGAPMNAVEVLGDKDTGLAIHNISLTDLFVDSNSRAGYTIGYTLGTYEEDTYRNGIINSSDAQCLAQSEETNNYTFCAINQFAETIITERAS